MKEVKMIMALGRQKGANAKDKDQPLFTRLQRSFGTDAR